jgi:hypothetical protein
VSGVVGVLLVVSLVGGQAPARSGAWRSEAYVLLTERSRGSPRERPEFLAWILDEEIGLGELERGDPGSIHVATEGERLLGRLWQTAPRHTYP